MTDLHSGKTCSGVTILALRFCLAGAVAGPAPVQFVLATGAVMPYRFPARAGQAHYRSRMEPTHYVFVDFENVQSVDLDLIVGKPVQIVLVLGKKQTAVPVGLVERWMEHSTQVRIVKTEASGKNALDFVLAYEAGLQSAADPDGIVHILSKDTGFEALVLHLRSRHQELARHIDFSHIPVLAKPGTSAPTAPGQPPHTPVRPGKASMLPSLSERVALITGKLAKNLHCRPKRRKTLLSYISGAFAKKLPEDELEATLDALVAAKVIEITPERGIRYHV